MEILVDTEKPDFVTVTCRTCGAKYTMPNAGILPVMNNCPKCIKKDKKPKEPITQLRAGKPIGEHRKYVSHFEQDIVCAFINEVVTITVSKKGLIVCRNWKECEYHGRELPVPGLGITACPERQWRELLMKQRRQRR